MLLHMSPRDWFFIFLAVLLASYVKLASAKAQLSTNPLFKLTKISRSI
jgi:uncharacterized membrane protein